MVKNPAIATISLDGDTLCLNYVNTVHNRRDDPLPDYLFSPLDLVAWAAKVELIDEKLGKKLERTVEDNQRKAHQLFVDAIRLRELLYRIFFSVVVDQPIIRQDLIEFNAFLQQYYSHLELFPDGDRYSQGWNFPAADLHIMVAPIIRDAYELLLSDRLRRVKECPNCGWLFLDRSKNGKRRWCSMKNCGSSIKALDWYYRQRPRP